LKILEGEIIMKKLLTLALLFGSIAIFGTAAEAKAAENSKTAIEANALPQDRWQRNRRINQNRRWNNRVVRIVNRTRIVRVGRQRYRETIQIRYLPYGRTQTRVISRVRIR
jgi:hypothetical protein